MRERLRYVLICVVVLLTSLGMKAQIIRGVVVDAATGDSIPFANIVYAGCKRNVTSEPDGTFVVKRCEGDTLRVSYIGFQPYVVAVDRNTPQNMRIVLHEDRRLLTEVVVKSKGVRYKRKNNPAVELMRRVIDARQLADPHRHDYFQFTKYQKLTLALDDYSPSKKDSLKGKAKRWKEFAEVSPYNGKQVLPVTVNESVVQHVFRKEPKSEKDIVLGKQSRGLNELLFSGENVNTMLKEVFQDVNIYEDYVRLLQYPFVSPIGREAISFYHYYIADTLMVDNRECYHLHFFPANKQDMGFKGELFVLTDSSLHVKRCRLELPQQADVNFVRSLHVLQDFEQLDNGEWVLSKDEMWAEMKALATELLVVRNTHLKDYAFDELPATLFRGKSEVKTVANALSRDDAFWEQHRAAELSQKEQSVSGFMEKLRHSKGMRVPLFVVKLFVENYIETGCKGKPSKFDFGPMLSTFSYNHVDGFRTRIGGRTMAALHKHWFADGYVAHAYRSRKTYYGANLTYSFNAKKNSPFEFPRRSISFESSYDIMSMADKYMVNNIDNLLVAIKTERITDMFRFNRQVLRFDYETDFGLSCQTSLKTESNETAGSLHFRLLDTALPELKTMRTTEWQLALKYAPGQTFVNTKQNRYPINFDNPEVTLKHTMGFKGFLGGDYKSNLTELSVYKRQWLGSFGYLDLRLEGAAQWNKVPFPLLLTPPIALSYIEQEGTMNMLHNMEFFMDRKLTWMIAWDMNGKLFHRIPLLKKLKIREYFAFKGVWGKLTDHNNPFRHSSDALLMQFPEGSYAINPRKPYMEAVVGIHNIFKIFCIEWVRRLNYNDHPGTHKNGVRFGLSASF